MPIRSGERQRARSATTGVTPCHTRDDSGLPCRNPTVRSEAEAEPASRNAKNESSTALRFASPAGATLGAGPWVARGPPFPTSVVDG